MHYCNEPLASYDFTKICQIFVSKMSTISDLTNQIMIPDPSIMEWWHQQNVYRLPRFSWAHREPVHRLRSFTFHNFRTFHLTCHLSLYVITIFDHSVVLGNANIWLIGGTWKFCQGWGGVGAGGPGWSLISGILRRVGAKRGIWLFQLMFQLLSLCQLLALLVVKC